MANTAKKDPTQLGGVLLDKVDRDTMLEFAKRLNIGGDKDSNEQLVTALNKRFEKLVGQPNRLADCDTCHGSSDVELEVCPFCGASNDEEDETQGAASSDDDSTSASSASDDVPMGEEDEASASDDDGSSSASSDFETASASMDDEPEAVEAGNRMAEKPARTVAGVKKGEEIVAPAEVVTSEVQHFTEADLNHAVDRVRQLKGDSTVSLWRLGAEIKNIYDRALWKQRNTQEGAPAYKSFSVFVQKELGFTVQNAYWLIDISTNYSEEQVRAFGTAKLNTILAAPKQAQAALLEEAKKGASVRELKERVKEENEKAGTSGQERETGRRTPRKKGGRSKGRKPREPKITVAALTGRHKIKLYRQGSEDGRAKRLGDGPHGELDLENGVTMKFQIRADSSGELILIADIKRKDA